MAGSGMTLQWTLERCGITVEVPAHMAKALRADMADGLKQLDAEHPQQKRRARQEAKVACEVCGALIGKRQKGGHMRGHNSQAARAASAAVEAGMGNGQPEPPVWEPEVSTGRPTGL